MIEYFDCKDLAVSLKREAKRELGGNTCVLSVVEYGEMSNADKVFLHGIERDAAEVGITVKRYIDNYAAGILQIGNKSDFASFGDADVDGGVSGYPHPMAVVEAVEFVVSKEIENTDGLNALVIGRGKVGRQVFDMLLPRNFTVSVAHRFTESQNLRWLARSADIIVIAGATGLDLTAYAADGASSFVVDLTGDNNISAEGLGTVKVVKGIGKLTRAFLLARTVRNATFWKSDTARLGF